MTFHDVKSWRQNEDLAQANLVMGDAPIFTLVSWLELEIFSGTESHYHRRKIFD